MRPAGFTPGGLGADAGLWERARADAALRQAWGQDERKAKI